MVMAAVPSAAIVVFKLKNMQINKHKVGKIVWPTTRVRLSGLVLFTSERERAWVNLACQVDPWGRRLKC